MSTAIKTEPGTPPPPDRLQRAIDDLQCAIDGLKAILDPPEPADLLKVAEAIEDPEALTS